MNFDKQLYESGLTAQGSYDKMDQYDQEAIIRFAELIVRECADLVLPEGKMTIVAADRDALDIYEEIREHFGVEE